MRAGALIAVLSAIVASGCASTGAPARDDDYFRYVGFRGRSREVMALRWLDGQQPVRVHLPRPSAGLFEDPEGIYDSVRDGVTDWADVASAGVPSFRFVEEAGDADVRIVWAAQPDGAWYVAHCAWNVNVVTRTFAVERIVVTARWPDGRVADLHDVYETMLHEMGHALGLGGHSPDRSDIMFASILGDARELSDRDRNTLRKLYSRPNGWTIPGAKRSD